jgi:putative peptidoglycan lipid II flippase
MLGIEERWGVAGLTAAAGAAGWVEFALLRRRLNHRIGTTGLPLSFIAKLWGSAIVAGAVAWGVKLAVGTIHPLLLAVLVLVPYALVYVATTTAFGMPEARSVSGQVLRLVRGRRRGA